MTTITLADAAKDIRAAIRKARRGPVALQSRGRCVAAIVSAEVLEDLEDIREAEKALAEHAKNPAAAVSLDEYLARRETRRCPTR